MKRCLFNSMFFGLLVFYLPDGDIEQINKNFMSDGNPIISLCLPSELVPTLYEVIPFDSFPLSEKDGEPAASEFVLVPLPEESTVFTAKNVKKEEYDNEQKSN